MRRDYKRLLSIAPATALLLLAACGSGTGNAVSENTIQASVPVPESAQIVVAAMRDAKLPIVDINSVSEVTDDNHLLGRPGQYTSKLFFYDARHPKAEGTEGENTIEVFANPLDAKRRHDYIDQITSGVGMLTQYQILHGPVLMRLDKVLLPAEAKAYEKAMKAAFPL